MAARQGVKLKDHQILALDIGSRFIKVAELRLAKGAISLLSVAVRPTPVGVMDNSQILDPVGLGRAVRELLSLNRIKTRKVVVSIGRQSSVVVRPIDLPRMTIKELADTMKFEVERHIPFAVDEVVMDYAPFVDPITLPESESNMKVLLAVAQEELINAYLKVLNVAGLQPVVMDVEILAAMRALVDIEQENGSHDRAVALVNIGAGSTDISIVDKGFLTFTRSVPVGGDALTEAIADQLGRSFEEAEELKKAHGRVFLDVSAGELPVPPEGLRPSAGMPTGIATASTPPPADFHPQNVFSLEEDTPVAPAPTPVPPINVPSPSPAPAVAMSAPPAFQLDDDGIAEVRVYRPDDDDDEPVTPVFSLDASTATVGNSSPMFQLEEDDDDDDFPPMIPIDIEDDTQQASGMPVFAGSDGYDDEAGSPPILDFDANSLAEVTALMPEDVPEPEIPVVAPPEVQAESVPSAAAAGPVFDLSSELEEQLPPPLARSTPNAPAPAEPIVAPTTDAPDIQVPLTMSTPGPMAPPEPLQIGSTTGPPHEEDAPFSFDGFGLPIQGDKPIFETTPFMPTGEEDTPPTFEATSFMPTVEEDAAPAFERPDVPQGDIFQRRIYESMLPTLVELVTEIRRSLEYYSSREPDNPVRSIMLYGGTSRLPNLGRFIQQEIEVDVHIADPIGMLDLRAIRQPDAYIQELAPALPICIGLGLRDMLA